MTHVQHVLNHAHLLYLLDHGCWVSHSIIGCAILCAFALTHQLVLHGFSTLHMHGPYVVHTWSQTWQASSFSGVASVPKSSTALVHRSVPGGKQVMDRLSRYLHGSLGLVRVSVPLLHESLKIL